MQITEFEASGAEKYGTKSPKIWQFCATGRWRGAKIGYVDSVHPSISCFWPKCIMPNTENWYVVNTEFLGFLGFDHVTLVI